MTKPCCSGYGPLPPEIISVRAIERRSRFRYGGATIMEGLLAWERIPWLLKPWVSAVEVEDWAADGWRGVLELRDHGAERASLSLSRQQSRACLKLGDLAEVELVWSSPAICADSEPATEAQPGEAQPGEAQPGEAQLVEAQPGEAEDGGVPTLDSTSLLERRVRAKDPTVLRAVDWGLRRMLHVAAWRARLLGRRLDGAGFPADRCRRCFGPLSHAQDGMMRRCAWSGHE